MLWRKREQSIDSFSKKILLERKMFWGRLHTRRYVECDLPHPKGHPPGTVFCLTRLRPLWRFHLRRPLQSTYFTLNTKGRWVQTCRTFH